MTTPDNPAAQVETRTSFITWRADHIMHIMIKEGAEIVEKDQQEIHQTCLKLAGENVPYLVLADARKMKSMAPEARRYSSSKGVESTRRLAILVSSLVSRIVGNTFMGLNKPKNPTKLFTSEKQAVAWLGE